MLNQWSNIRGFFVFSLIFIFVLIADVLIVYTYYRYVCRFVEEQPIDIKADAGVVFFGDYVRNGAELGPDSRYRAGKAIDLYQKGAIASIVCVGGYDISRWKGRPHLMKQYLISHGVLKQDILHDSVSFNTITNWQEACKIMDQNDFDTIIAISSPLHILRISQLAPSGPVYYSAYEHHPENMRDYWQIFKDVHREFVSHFLNYALKDRVRNQLVRIYRTIWFELNRIL